MISIEELKQKCLKIKKTCLEMCIQAGTGHVTSAFSCAEIVTSLYYNIMDYKVEEPSWDGRDYFIMSKNHGSVITYPILADLGFISMETLKTFLNDGSLLGSHSKITVPGVEFSGGSLGIGFGVGCGISYANKIDRKTSNTYILIGDGECYEGSIWESAMFAGAYELSNLVVFLDRNYMCVTDYTENLLTIEPIDDKWKAFGWDVKHIDGHNFEEIINSVKGIKYKRTKKPLCIICDTIKGNGIDFMSGKLFMHGVAPKGEYAKLALKQLEGEI